MWHRGHSVSLPASWGATAQEIRAAVAVADGEVLVRAVTVDAPTEIAFRWLCQLKVAPYSFDLVDNFGRRSPRALTPGMEKLTVGEPVMRIFALADFVEGESLTLRMTDPKALRLFGPMTVTYRVKETVGGARLTCVLDLPTTTGVRARVLRYALAWGDLVMMRKQLLTLRDLSENASRIGAEGPE